MSDVGHEASPDDLAEALARLDGRSLVVVTGAGVSLASGVPTFRGDDPDAVWHHSILELGTYRFFREDPVTNWRWSLERFASLHHARPNPAHRALVELERIQQERGDFLLVTQNIDTLHEQAGSLALVKVHGSVDRLRCASEPDEGCLYGAPAGSLPRAEIDLEPFVAAPSLDTVPRCPACGDLLRQHVLWFDEYYAAHDDFQWQRTRDAADTVDFVLFVGTSFAVGVTEVFLQSALWRGVPVWSIDPAGLAPYPGMHVVPARAEEALPEIAAALGRERARSQ
ncbi:MAG: Sir2 family NAD-dependent protein deacetylase [Acidobacteriota bacterium]